MVMRPDDKDAALFPAKFGGRWAMVHRPANAKGSHIWLSFSPDLKHWGDSRVLLTARSGGWWDNHKIGLGPEPLLTERRLAAVLPRRSQDRRRRDLPGRAGPARHRRPVEGAGQGR